MENAPDLRFKIQLHKSDYLELYRHSTRWLYLVIPLVAAAFWSATAGKPRELVYAAKLALTTRDPIGLTLVSFVLFMAAILIAAPELLARWYTRKVLRNTPSAGEPIDLWFTARDISFNAPSQNGQLRWSAIAKAREKRTGLRLYVGPWSFLFIPWSQVPELDKREALRQLVRIQMGSRARIQPSR